jgi:hypothetical protein
VRRARVLVVLAAVVLTVTGCTPERTNEAQFQGYDLMQAAGLPIESVNFSVVDGTVTASAQRWVGSPQAPELDEPAVAKLLWQRSIAEIDQIEVETIQDPTGRSLALRRFSEQELTTRFGPRPAGVVQVTAEQMEREERAFMGSVFLLFFGMPLLVMVAAVVVALAIVAVVVVVIIRARSSAPAPFTG